MTDPRQRVDEINNRRCRGFVEEGLKMSGASRLKGYGDFYDKWVDELVEIATAALDREAEAREVIQRVWEHGCCCSDDEDYYKCDMVKAAKEWLESEAQDDG